VFCRFYDDSLNPDSIKWTRIQQSKHYIAPASQAREGSDQFVQLNKAVIVLFFFSILAIIARTCSHPLCVWPRLVYWITCATHTLAVLLLGLSLVLLNEDFGAIRAVLHKHPLIPVVSTTSYPDLKWGWSFQLTICSILFYTAALWPLWNSFPVDPDADVSLIKQRDRQKRLSSYFFDVSNTTYMKEAKPVDNASQVTKHGIKIKGWTAKVQSVKLNSFAMEPGGMGGGARSAAPPIEPPDLEAGHVEDQFSGTLEWRSKFSQMNKKKPPRRGSAKETNHAPSGNSPDKNTKKGRRATMGEIPTMGSLPGGLEDALPDRPATAGSPAVEDLQKQFLVQEASRGKEMAARPGTTMGGRPRPAQGRVSLSEIAGRPAFFEERQRKVGRVPRRHSLALDGPDNNPTAPLTEL